MRSGEAFWRRDYDAMARFAVRRLKKLTTEDGDLFRGLREIVVNQDRVRPDRRPDILTLLDDIGTMVAREAEELRLAMTGVIARRSELLVRYKNQPQSPTTPKVLVLTLVRP